MVWRRQTVTVGTNRINHAALLAALRSALRATKPFDSSCGKGRGGRKKERKRKKSPTAGLGYTTHTRPPCRSGPDEAEHPQCGPAPRQHSPNPPPPCLPPSLPPLPGDPRCEEVTWEKICEGEEHHLKGRAAQLEESTARNSTKASNKSAKMYVDKRGGRD